MLTFPLSLVLLPYALVLLIVAVLAIMSLGHLLHYGATTFFSFLVTFAYLAGTAAILFVTWQQVRDVDWQTPVEIRLAMPGLPSENFAGQTHL